MKRFLILTTVLVTALSAAPAFERQKTFVQPDGFAFEGTLKGDEHLHWIETENGTVLVFNRVSKQYEHAYIADGALRPDGTAYGSHGLNQPRSRDGGTVTPAALRQLWTKIYQKKTVFRQLKK